MIAIARRLGAIGLAAGIAAAAQAFGTDFAVGLGAAAGGGLLGAARSPRRGALGAVVLAGAAVAVLWILGHVIGLGYPAWAARSTHRGVLAGIAAAVVASSALRAWREAAPCAPSRATSEASSGSG